MWFPSGPSAGEVRNGRFLLKVYRLLGSRWKGRESEISWDEDALCPQNRQEPSSLPAVPRRLLTDVQPFSRFSTLVYKKLLILYLKFTYSWALFHLAPYRRPPAVAGGGGGRSLRFVSRWIENYSLTLDLLGIWSMIPDCPNFPSRLCLPYRDHYQHDCFKWVCHFFFNHSVFSIGE